MSIKPKLDPIRFSVVKMIAVSLRPHDIKPSGRARFKASIDRNSQRRSWIKPATDAVVTDQRFDVENDIPDCHKGIIIDWARIAREAGHGSGEGLAGIVEANRSLREVEILLCGLPHCVILPACRVIRWEFRGEFRGGFHTVFVPECINPLFELL